MLDIGWTEMAVVAVIAVIVIGPKDLPRIMRAAGRWARKARSMAREFQSGIDDMVRESEVGEVKKGFDSIADYSPAKEIENAIDPTGTLAKDLDPANIESEDDAKVAPADDTGAPPTDSSAAGDAAPANAASGGDEPGDAEPDDTPSGGDEPGDEPGDAAARRASA